MAFAKAFENSKKRKNAPEPPSLSAVSTPLASTNNNTVLKQQLSGETAQETGSNEVRKRRRGRKGSTKDSQERQDAQVETVVNRQYNNNNNNNNNNNYNYNKDGDKPKKRKRLSQEALSLSADLQELSQKKQLTQALKLYWDSRHEKIRDGFHACIAIDCCARCGDMQEADKIIKEVKRSGRIVNVQTKTALIKGYSHNGDIAKAVDIFQAMCREKLPEHQPNVRTLNTLLRGCLWTAATVNNKDQMVGGVISAEKAWKAYKDLSTASLAKTDDNSSRFVDISSFEYSISLLTQALRIDDAVRRIEELRDVYGVRLNQHEFLGGNHTVLETLATAYLGLGRASALLGHKKEALEACKLARNAISKSKDMFASDDAGGEKRAWRNSEDSRRTMSNSAFRGHRLSELDLSVQSTIQVCQSDNFPPSSELLAKRLVNGLFYFSGGGTTKKEKEKEKEKETILKGKGTPDNQMEARLLRRHLVNSSWLGFGLAAAMEKGRVDLPIPPSLDFVRVKLSERIFREIGPSTNAVRDNGFVDFDSIFPGDAKPLDIELGAGHGDWIMNQAANKPDRNHIAVELRSDRVAQIFANGFLRASGPLENLCVVGDDSNAFMTQRLKPGSVSTIFVNHPEPPTQAFGEDDSDLQAIMSGGHEPAHMLSSSALRAAATCLNSQGRIVIVTDNRSYAKLLGATVVKVNSSGGATLQSEQFKHKSSGLREIDRFGKRTKSQYPIQLLEGQPCEAIGHAVESVTTPGSKKGSSYFDRLWRTGASSHASKRERYILVLKQA